MINKRDRAEDEAQQKRNELLTARQIHADFLKKQVEETQKTEMQRIMAKKLKDDDLYQKK